MGHGGRAQDTAPAPTVGGVPWRLPRPPSAGQGGGLHGIERTTSARLRDSERAELETILREFAGQQGQFTSRYHADAGDTLAWFLLLGIAGVVGLVACVFEAVPEHMLEALRFDFARGLLRLLRDPLALGCGAALIATLVSAWTLWRVRGRCGTAVTSFGVTSVFGGRLRLLRWLHIAAASRRRIGSRRTFSMLELTAKNGQRFVTYATPLMDAIEAHVQG